MNGETLKDLLRTTYRVISLEKKKVDFFIDSLERIATFGKLKNDIALAKLLNEILQQYGQMFEKPTLAVSQELKGIEKKLREGEKNEDSKTHNN